jgi:membrane fusion protein (multidrug efflux system)
MKKVLLILSITLALTLASCQRSDPPAQADTNKPKATDTTSSVLEVSTAPVIERSLTSSLELTGNLEGQEEITVSSEIDGKVSEMYIDLGTYIKKGDKLFSLDERELAWRVDQAQAALAAARIALGESGKPGASDDVHPNVRDAFAALEKAKLDYERTEKLFQDGVIARQELDRTKSLYDQTRARWEVSIAQVESYRANLTQAEANLQLARKQLADAVIYSPLNGVIKERLVSAGEYVKKGQQVARIVQINPLRLRTNVPEQYIQQLKQGESLVFSVDSLPTTKFNGTITRFSPSVDKTSRALMIEAKVDNPNLQLRPGMFARTNITFGEKKTALLVPEKAVVTAVGLKKVYVLVDGKAQAREVSVGQKDGDLVEIQTGLKQGDLAITSSLDKLADGTPVTSQAK